MPPHHHHHPPPPPPPHHHPPHHNRFSELVPVEPDWIIGTIGEAVGVDIATALVRSAAYGPNEIRANFVAATATMRFLLDQARRRRLDTLQVGQGAIGDSWNTYDVVTEGTVTALRRFCPGRDAERIARGLSDGPDEVNALGVVNAINVALVAAIVDTETASSAIDTEA